MSSSGVGNVSKQSGLKRRELRKNGGVLWPSKKPWGILHFDTKFLQKTQIL